VNPQLPSAARLIDSFLKDLQGIAALFAGGREKETFTVTINVATGASASWTVDQDCVLIAIYGIPAGTIFSVGRNKMVGSEASVANAILVRQVILAAQQSGAGVPLHNFRVREPFGTGQKLWLNNAGAAAITLNFLFES
jgi:hypothetical protein